MIIYAGGVIVNGTDVIPETMTGTICSLIASSQKNDDKKVIIVITNGENDTVKIYDIHVFYKYFEMFIYSIYRKPKNGSSAPDST